MERLSRFEIKLLENLKDSALKKQKMRVNKLKSIQNKMEPISSRPS